ncbi:MAG: thioredoxin [Kofleriaceae bacterium]
MIKGFVLLLALAGSAACQSGASKLDLPPGKLELVAAPAVHDVAPLIAKEAARAAHDHKKLLVYLGATWCEPCVKFHEAAAAGLLDQAFGDVRMLVFDADRDSDALERAGYKYTLVPLFALPGPDGRSTGRQIEGSVKGAHYVEEISPRLRGLIDAPSSPRAAGGSAG